MEFYLYSFIISLVTYRVFVYTLYGRMSMEGIAKDEYVMSHDFFVVLAFMPYGNVILLLASLGFLAMRLCIIPEYDI